MTAFLMSHLQAVLFAYGLIFFTMGFAILLRPRQQSGYFLASALTWLALFGLTHAFADWGLVFIPAEGDPAIFRHLHYWRYFGVIISFGFLLQFGVVLMTEDHPARKLLRMAPAALTAAMALMLAAGIWVPGLLPDWLTDIKVLSRYLMAFPGALLAARGLVIQAEALQRDRMTSHKRNLYGAAICLVVYGVVAGLVVPSRDFFPASHLNVDLFMVRMGIPVEVARMAAMAGLTFFVLRLLTIFEIETQRRLHAMERDRALLRERELIARELHDGIMQTLYGTGLGLKQVMAMNCFEEAPARSILTIMNQEIARSIVQMRTFVLDLKEAVISGKELIDAASNLAAEIGQIAGIAVTVEIEGDWERVRVPGGLREEVLAVIREGLSNVVRHADAHSVHLLISCEDGTMLIRLSDDGDGYESAATPGKGLSTLRDRVEALGGYLQVLSEVGVGTQLVAHLPLRSKLAGQEGEHS